MPEMKRSWDIGGAGMGIEVLEAASERGMTSSYEAASGSRVLQCSSYHRLRFLEDAVEGGGAREAFSVELVDIFRPRRAGGEPVRARFDLEAADGGAVAGGGRQHARDRFAGEGVGVHLIGRQLRELRFLRGVGRGVDAPVG